MTNSVQKSNPVKLILFILCLYISTIAVLRLTSDLGIPDDISMKYAIIALLCIGAIITLRSKEAKTIVLEKVRNFLSNLRKFLKIVSKILLVVGVLAFLQFLISANLEIARIVGILMMIAAIVDYLNQDNKKENKQQDRY